LLIGGASLSRQPSNTNWIDVNAGTLQGGPKNRHNFCTP